MFPNRDSGSTSMAAIVSLAALAMATMYVKNLSEKIGKTTREAKIVNLSEDAQILSMSNLATLRALLNPRKVATDLYEPALYAENYFADRWQLTRNSLIANIRAESEGNSVSVRNQERAISDTTQTAKRLRSTNSMQFSESANRSHALQIVRLNPHPDHPYYIESIDVRADVEVSEKSGENTLKKTMPALGRISLLAPTPNSITLQIKPETGGSWSSTEFGTAADPLPAGRYLLRLLGGGVVYSGHIESSTGMKLTLGLKDGAVTHKSYNIHSKNVEIGTTEPVELGENKTFVVATDPITNLVNIGVPGENGSITDPQVHYSSGSCRFSSSPGSPPVPSGPVLAETTTESSTESTTTTTVPSEMTLTASLTGVDGEIFDEVISRKVHIQNRVTTKHIQKTITTTKRTAVAGNGDDGRQCSSYCPRSTADATGPDQWSIMWPAASKGDAVPTKTRDFVENNNGYNGLPITGVSCVNYDLTAQKIMQVTGAPSVDAIKNANNDVWWAAFEQQWGGGAAKNLERYIAYVLPSCQRQIVGNRDACGCFDEATLIRMGDGTEKTVKDIRQGDLVWNPKTNRAHPVKRVIAGPETIPMIRLDLSGKSIVVTQKHPFLSADGLKAAKDFVKGEMIWNENTGMIVEATSLVEPDHKDPPVVWNFELEGSESDEDHYLLANGVMTGDLYLQIKLEESLSERARP